jgi:hypothetical protein
MIGSIFFNPVNIYSHSAVFVIADDCLVLECKCISVKKIIASLSRQCFLQ